MQMNDEILHMYGQVQEMGPNQGQNNNNDLTTNGVCKKFIHGKCLNKNCPHPHNKAKIKACENYENSGKCKYGEKCNFSHEIKVCDFFKRGECEKGPNCLFRHVYKTCPNFDTGFCLQGADCEFKHITRRICWDYLYGFCEKGSGTKSDSLSFVRSNRGRNRNMMMPIDEMNDRPRCENYHPKIFHKDDFVFSDMMDEFMSRKPYRFTCNGCGIIGHKISNCPKKKELAPDTIFRCGLCGAFHAYQDKCDDFYGPGPMMPQMPMMPPSSMMSQSSMMPPMM